MLGNRLKRSAIVLAVFAVLMMAFFAMAKEVHADDTYHFEVTTNYEDALVEFNWSLEDDDTGDTIDEGQANKGDSVLLEAEYPLTFEFPVLRLTEINYDKGNYQLLDVEYNEYAADDWEQLDGGDKRLFFDNYVVESNINEFNAFAIFPIEYDNNKPPLVNNIKFVFKKNVSDEDIAAAQAFDDAVAALPEALKITTDNKDAVEAARALYDALSDDALDLISESSVAKLELAEKIIGLYDQLAQAEIDKAQAVTDAVNAANAQAEIDKNKAVADAVKDANDKAEKAKEEAVNAAVKDANNKAEKAKEEAVNAAVKDANDKAEKAKEEAVNAAIKDANDKAEKDKKEAVDAAVKDANDKAEKAKEEAVNAAVKDANDKAEKAKEKAVNAAVKDANEKAEKAKEKAVNAAIKDANDKAEKDKKEAVNAAVKDANDKAAAEKDSAVQAAEKAAEAKVNEAVAAKEAAEAAVKTAEETMAKAQESSFVPVGKVQLKGVKGAKKKLTVKWEQVEGAEGYEVIIAKNKKFTKSTKTYTIKKADTLKKTVKKLKKGKYFVKVRAYKAIGDNTVYGSFSEIKKNKVK